MPRFGAVLAGLGAGAKNLQAAREREQADAERLEDRLARKEMQALEKRRLEDLLNAPPAPEALEVTLDDAGQRVYTPRSQAAGRRAPEPPAPAEPLEDIIGPDGKTIRVPRSQAINTRVPEKPAPERPPTQNEQALSLLAPALVDARDRLKKFGNPDILKRLVAQGGMFTNWLNTTEGRQFAQAANQYVQNIIYAKSGKAVTEKEARGMWNIYIPMPGDDDQTIADKLHTMDIDTDAVVGIATRGSPRASSADDFTDAELAAAYQAGKRTDAEIAAWIRTKRGSK